MQCAENQYWNLDPFVIMLRFVSESAEKRISLLLSARSCCYLMFSIIGKRGSGVADKHAQKRFSQHNAYKKKKKIKKKFF